MDVHIESACVNHLTWGRVLFYQISFCEQTSDPRACGEDQYRSQQDSQDIHGLRSSPMPSF
jgi:hypothetical protein